MKVVHVTYSDNGGAGAAAVRLHLGLLDSGIDSNLLVVKNTRIELPKVFVLKEPFLIRLQRVMGYWVKPLRTKPQKLYRELGNEFSAFEAYSLPWSDFRLENHPLVLEADIIHFHWVGGMINYRTFFSKVQKPLVWTLHDMNPFLGGLHYEFDTRLGISPGLQKLEQEILRVKRESLTEVNAMSIISPSSWMMNKASQSELLSRFRHIHLPNGLGSKPFETKIGSNSNKNYVIGFAAESLSNRRKGYSVLLDYLKSNKRDTSVKFICAGEVSQSNRCEGVEYIGRVETELGMAQFYQSLDAFLICSLEDNLPNVIVESLYCGTPVLGFRRSGMIEMVEQNVNGLLTDEANPEGIMELIDGFKWQQFDSISISAAAKKKYSLEKQLLHYKEEVLDYYN